MSYGKNERDDFWDLEKIMPKRRTVISPFATEKKKTSEVIISGSEKPTYTKEERKIPENPYFAKNFESEEYYPEWNPLIKRVIISRFKDKYDFYDGFRKSAILYYDVPGTKSPFVKFYSYMPQYSQMNQGQKNYYFFWRSELRRGKYLETDYSYLYLYVYEILNLPDKIPASEGIKILCNLWREYRGALPRIDLYFSIWVQDYCLIHRLPSPTEYIKDFIYAAVSASSFKEFYLSDIEATGSEGVNILLAFLSDYDYRSGKYAGGETKEEYKRHMEGAMRPLLNSIKSASGGGEPERIIRDAFPNSLCTHSVKSKLEIEYYPLAKEKDLRSKVTAAVRYTENKIRAALGVKSRLGVKGLTDEYRILIDCYFDVVFKEERQRKEAANTPEYMKLYDAPREEMSFSGADEIEKISWTTTARLVENSEQEESVYAFSSEPECEPSSEQDNISEDKNNYGLMQGDLAYMADKLGFATNLSKSSDNEDSIVERINEAFYDNFGDIVLEDTGDGYAVIPDYESELKEWLTKILK